MEADGGAAIDKDTAAPRPSEAWSIVDEPSDVEIENALKGPLAVKEFGGGPSANKGA